MAVKVLKPTTPGRRHMSVADFKSTVTKSKPEKRLTVSLKRHAGRNSQGIITIFHRGGGHKKKYRLIDFKQTDKLNMSAVVKAIEYDPNRNSYIALVYYRDGEKRYHLAPQNLHVGDTIVAAEKTKIRPGNRLKLKNIPPGFNIYNIEIFPNKGGQLSRSAGTSAKILSIEGEYAYVELPSSEVRLISKECFACIGTLSNEDHKNISWGKAGRTRYLGRRPTVRGKAKNPVDHPHGGGQGNQPIGLKHPKTPWGMPALGFKTRKRKLYSNIWIVRRRKKKN